MMTILIVSTALSLISVALMVYNISVDFHCKHQMLKLFQFGYCGLLLLTIMHHLVIIAEIDAGLYRESRADVFYYMTDFLNACVVVPYFLYSLAKKKLNKA